jgi:hypothetical protein
MPLYFYYGFPLSIPDVTTTVPGLMSAADKVKLDGLAPGDIPTPGTYGLWAQNFDASPVTLAGFPLLTVPGGGGFLDVTVDLAGSTLPQKLVLEAQAAATEVFPGFPATRTLTYTWHVQPSFDTTGLFVYTLQPDGGVVQIGGGVVFRGGLAPPAGLGSAFDIELADGGGGLGGFPGGNGGSQTVTAGSGGAAEAGSNANGGNGAALTRRAGNGGAADGVGIGGNGGNIVDVIGGPSGAGLFGQYEIRRRSDNTLLFKVDFLSKLYILSQAGLFDTTGLNGLVVDDGGFSTTTFGVGGHTSVRYGGVAQLLVFSPTPIFEPGNGEAMRIVLTANITSWTVLAGADAQRCTLYFEQSAGGNTLAGTPGNVRLAGGAFALSAAAGAVDTLSLQYQIATATWYETSRSMAL